MAVITVHQHYVYRGYLRAWTHDEKIFCLRNRRNLFQTNIMNIAQENLFYEFQECTDEEIQIGYHFAEKTPCDKLIDVYCLINSELKSIPHTEEKNITLSNFAKEFEEKHFNFPIEERLKKFLYALYSKDFSFLNDEGDAMEFYHAIAEQYCRTNRVKEGVVKSLEELKNPNIRAHNVWLLIRHIVAFKIGLHLFYNKYQVCLLENSEVDFITTDQPLINIHGDYQNIPEKFEIYYPITPKLALVISKQEIYQDKQIITIANNDVIKWNDILVEISHNQIFSNCEDSLKRYVCLKNK